MNIIEALQSFDCFTNAEKSIIRVIFQNPDALPGLTAQQLAKAAYTSTSTVVRLCQKMECKNYNEFRTRLVAEMQLRRNGNVFVNANVPFCQEDPPETILRHITDLQINALHETLAQMDMKRFNHAVDMLDAADCIDIYGMGINQHLAFDFAHKMMRIQRQVQIFVDYVQQMVNASTRFKNHCAIVISYTGESLLTIQYVKQLHCSGTPIVAITSVGENTVASYANERLYIASMEKQFSKIGPFASTASISIILNYLYAGIFARDYDNNYQKLLSTVLRVTNFRSNAEPLREENEDIAEGTEK